MGEKMKKIIMLTTILAITLMMSSCSTTNNQSVISAGVGVAVNTDPAKAEYSIGNKISGSASATYLFGMLPLSEPNSFADGVSGFGGFGGSAKVKSAAAFNAMESANADMIINPQYVVTMNKTLLTTTYKATVTGWAGNVTNVTK